MKGGLEAERPARNPSWVHKWEAAEVSLSLGSLQRRAGVGNAGDCSPQTQPPFLRTMANGSGDHKGCPPGVPEDVSHFRALSRTSQRIPVLPACALCLGEVAEDLTAGRHFFGKLERQDI